MKTISLRNIPEKLLEYIEEKLQDKTFNNLSHGLIRLAYIGMEVEKHRAKVVHEWEGIGLKDGTTRVKVQGPPQKREPEE